jgi:hypothetical protein
VHGEDAAARQQIIQHRKDGLFDLAGVVGAADKDESAFEVEEDERLAVGAVGGRVGVHVASVNDGQARLEVVAFFGRRAQQQAAGEKSVPGLLADDAHRQPIARIGAGPGVAEEQFPPLQVGQQPIVEPIEDRGLHGTVDRAPPDVVADRGRGDDETVVRRAAGAAAGVGGQGAVGCQQSLAALHGQFHQRGRGQVGVDGAWIEQAMCPQVGDGAVAGVPWRPWRKSDG